MKGTPADSSNKLAGAKEALKDKLMQAVLQQAIQELGSPDSIADSLIDAASKSTEFQQARQSVVDRVRSEIETRSIDSISKSAEVSNSIFQTIQNESSVVPDTVETIRQKLIEDIHARSIESVSNSTQVSDEAYAKFDSNPSEVSEATSKLRAKLLDDITTRAAESVSDFDAVANELIDKLGSDMAIVDPVVGQLRTLLLARIEDRAVEALNDADTVAESIAKNFKADNSIIADAADALRNNLLTAVETAAISSVSNPQDVASEIRSGFDSIPSEISHAADALRKELINEIKKSGLESLTHTDDVARNAFDSIDPSDERISSVRQVLADRLMDEVTNSAIRELSERVGEVDASSLPDVSSFVTAAAVVPDSILENSLEQLDSVEDFREEPSGTETIKSDFSDQQWNDEDIDQSVIDSETSISTDESLTIEIDKAVAEDSHQSDNRQPVISKPQTEDHFTTDLAPATETTPISESGDHAYYVYGILSESNLPNDSELPSSGISSGRPVELIGYGNLRAAITRVDLDEFSGDAFKARLQDKGWLKDKVKLHSRVLEGLNTGRTIVPMRFCTVYRSEDEVNQILSVHNDHYSRVLGKIDGKQEWSVRIYRDEAKLTEKVADSDRIVETSLDSISKGVVHFVKEEMNRLNNVDSLQAIELMSQHCSSRSHAALMDCATDGIFKPTLNENGQDKSDIVLNAAYLVPTGQEDKLRDEVERLGSEYSELGFRFEVHGPWPPYHFVGEPSRSEKSVTA